MKNAWVAALLNIIPLGPGYFYLGHYGAFGYTLFLGVLAPFAGFLLGPVIIDGVLSSSYVMDCRGSFSDTCVRPFWVIALVYLGAMFPSLVISVSTGWSAYRRVKPKPEKPKPEKPKKETSVSSKTESRFWGKFTGRIQKLFRRS